MHEWGQPLFVQYHQWSCGGGTNIIRTCHYQVLLAWPFFNEHKLDGLEAVAIVSSKLTEFVISKMQTDSSELHNMHT